ncbi:MAG: BatD family protein [Reinekea sp.]|jgi:hypothetical protein
MVRIKRLCLFLVILLSNLAWADVVAHADRTELYDDETFQLSVTVSPIAELEQSDIDALQTLFEITRNYRQENHQSINGRSSSSITYLFGLQPKQVGNLAIPSFHAGNDESQPIFISVKDSSQRKDGLADDAVVLSATLDSTNPYVDQSVILTIELQTKISFAQGASLSDLQADDFDIEQLDTKNFTRNKGNSSVSVYQRILRLTPKKAGVYQLPDIRLTAQYPNQQLGRYVRLSRTASIEPIEVKPIPAEFPASAFWLPATNLTLTDNLSTPLSVAANEHLEWQITANIKGLDAKRLPDLFSGLESPLADNIRQYKNNPAFADSKRTDSTALVFTQPGQAALPAVRIPWWDLTTDSLQWATLPARNVQVTGSIAATVPAPAATSTNVATSPQQPEPLPASATQPADSTNSAIWKLTTALFAILWLATIVVLIWQRRSLPTKQPASTKPETRQKTPDSAKGFYQAIIASFREKGCSRNQLTPSQQEVLEMLENHLFKNGQAPDIKQIKALWKTVQQLKPETSETAEKNFTLYRA